MLLRGRGATSVGCAVKTSSQCCETCARTHVSLKARAHHWRVVVGGLSCARVRTYACVFACVCVRACVHARVCVCVFPCACVVLLVVVVAVMAAAAESVCAGREGGRGGGGGATAIIALKKDHGSERRGTAPADRKSAAAQIPARGAA